MSTPSYGGGNAALRRRGRPVRVGFGERRRNALEAFRTIGAPWHRHRLEWAVRVRWLVIVGFFTLAVIAHPLGLFPRFGALAVAAAVGAAVNVLNHWCVRRGRRVVLLTAVAVPMDSVLITYVIARTGGVQSPFLMMYSVEVVATAMLVTFAAALVSVSLAVCCFGALLALDAAHVVAISPLYASWLGGDVAARLGGGVWLGFLLYCLLLLIFVGGYVSDRLRQSETELAEKNRRLEASVASLQRARDELALAYERLTHTEAQLVQSEKMQALGLVVAGVAHELNNPLSFVWANIEHLRMYFGRLADLVRDRGGGGGDPGREKAYRERRAALGIDTVLEELPEVLRDCEEGARRATEIVAELRSFSRGGASEVVQSVDINAGLRSTVALLRWRLPPRVEVELDLEAVPQIRGWLGQLNQVFLNLLLNAVDAVDPGGRIRIGSRHRGGVVLVRVEDDGRGIPPEHIDKVFDPFFTTKEVGQGTGLGLSISYGIVQRHGGALRVSSTPGRGTVFEVELPVEAVS